MKSITDNKTFWKIVKSLFSDKLVQSGKITLVKDDEIIDDDREAIYVFNMFANAVKNLNIKKISDTENLTDNVNIVIKRYKAIFLSIM